jgi:hypothetical protein
MDLNVDNYSINELFNAIQISQNNQDEIDINTITVTKLQHCLLTKIEKIKLIDNEATNLPVSKENLIEFYTKAFFKIINDRNMINELRTTSSDPISQTNQADHNMLERNNATNVNNANKNDTLETGEYRDAYGKAAGNVYNTSYANPNQASASIQGKLLEPMPPTHTVQESSRFVTKHDNFNPVSTFNSNLKAGVLNPLVRKSLKKILNINTRFRNNYSATNSTNFTMDLPSTIKKVVSMKLVNIEFPKTVYTFSEKLGSNNFKIDGSLIEIDSGAYIADTLVTHLNNKSVMNAKNIELTYDDNTGLMTFKHNTNESFNIDFTYDSNLPNLSCQENIIPSNVDKNQLTLGWMLGFRGNYTNKKKVVSKSVHNPEHCKQKIKLNNQRNSKGEACNQYKIPQIYNCNTKLVKDYNDIYFGYSDEYSYTGESLFDMYGSHYFLLSINDYQNNHGELIISPFKDQTLASNNILAKISGCLGTGCKEMCHPERVYFGPTNISKLQIILYDEFGRIVDVNNADYSLTIELEVLYDL